MGLCFTTRGWAGSELIVTHAVDGSDTYSRDGDAHNALDVATDLQLWLAAGERPWAGSVSSVELYVEEDGGRLAFVFETDDPLSLDGGNDAWRDRMAVSNTTADEAVGHTRGSCSAVPGTVMWERWDTEIGGRNRSGSWRTGHPALSARRPTCELFLDLAQTDALNEALRIAAWPRRAYVLDELADLYRLAAVGKTELRPHKGDDVTKIVGTMEVLGEVAWSSAQSAPSHHGKKKKSA
ncbi:MAG: hypothetical protein H6716_28255 [Polyangiaceae bacterium]|nr:hypothetical protein [Polyangiaceae bacterium]